MGRIYHDNENYITSIKPNGFEITGAGPIDDRLIVQSFDDLINPDTFAGTPNVAYEGMLVSVLDEGSTYMLTGKKDNITEPESWVKQNSEYIVDYSDIPGNILNDIYPGYRYDITLATANSDTLDIHCNCIYPEHVNAFEFLFTPVYPRQIQFKCISKTGNDVIVTAPINKWFNNVGNTTGLITLVPGKKYMICVDKCKDNIIGMYCEI